MKQLAQFCSAGPVTAFVAALALCASLSGPCRADFDPGTDYGELMIEAAFRLLSGERVLNDPTVVFQSGGKQGSGVALELEDSIYGSVYFCYTSHPELYG